MGPMWAAQMGAKWAAQMGSMSIWPRAPCPPKMGSPRMSLHGLSVSPTWAAHYGLPIWAPCGQPRWALCPFGRGLHVRPKWAAHKRAYMGLVWVPLGQPIMGCQYGPQMGSPDGLNVHLAVGSMSAPNGQPTNEPTWAYCGPHLGSPLWAANMGPTLGAQMGL